MLLPSLSKSLLSFNVLMSVWCSESPEWCIFPSGSHPSSLTSSQVSPGSTVALPPQPLHNNPALIVLSNQPPLRCQKTNGAPFSHSLRTELIEIVRSVNPFSPRVKAPRSLLHPCVLSDFCNYLLIECILPITLPSKHVLHSDCLSVSHQMCC